MDSPFLYHKVIGSELTVEVGHEYRRQFTCLRTVLSDSFDVREGDVVGACLLSSSVNVGLDLLEEVDSYQLNLNIDNSCQDPDFDVLDLQEETWSVSLGMVLNINLEIGKCH